MSALELHPGSSSSGGTRSSPRTIPAKRAKAAQACTSCRKHKTRCEMLDGDSCGYQCHRCKVLNLPCSFDTSGAPCSENDLPPASRARLSDDNSTSRHHPSPSFPKFAQDIAMDDSVSSSPWNTSNTEQQPLTTRPMPQYRSQSNDDMDLLHPEGLFPIQQRPWGFLKLPGGFDGTTVPMLAMQALTRAIPNEEPLKNKVEISLLHILGKDKVKHLLDIFEERYSPWLNLQPSQRTEGPLLRLAQCCVASRHLDLPIKSIVAPQLYRLAEEVVFKQIFSPLPSTDSIHAMLILSMWEPVDDPTHKETKDGRLMASSAVSMAMNLRLSEAMVYVKTLREQMKDPSDSSAAELAEAVDKARLWFSLTNSESMLCIGTRRDPMSRCKDLIHDAIDSSSLSTIGAGRDLRLSLLSQVFATTEHGLSIRLLSIGDLGKFYKEVLDTLMKMDNLERLVSPLSVLAEHEVFYFHMLQVIYQWCRLLFLVHALMETKNIISKHHQEIPWFLLAEHNGINLARSWGQQALVLSEGILITSLSRPELALLSSAPDNFFSMITLATFFVVLSKWSMLQNTGEQLPGSSDSILAKTIERLSQVACSPDHAPARCAQLINACVLSFRRRASEKTESEPLEHSAPMLEHFNTAARNFTERVASTSSPSPFVTGEGIPQVFPSTFPINDPNYFMNSDIFLDNNFWASFMANLSEGSSG